MGEPSPGSGSATSSAPAPRVQGSEAWGRVDDEGNVYVRLSGEAGVDATGTIERKVGQYPGVSKAEALALYTRKYDELAFEVQLLEQRLASGQANPDEAAGAVKQLTKTIAEASVVGDLEALEARLGSLTATLAQARERKRAERAARNAETAAAKEALVAEAEKLSSSQDWKAGADRLRTLLEDWKALPRIDRPVDDALWKRFSGARTAYTKKRKAHFAELNEKRESAKAVKERLVTEAEALSTSVDWGKTAGSYRDLMSQWKAAGPAPKGVDDKLWSRFRQAQDVFFEARAADNKATDAEFAANAEVKEAILLEAEKLLPIKDLGSTKAKFRDLADRWEEAGKVPRERMKDLEGRMRKVEQAIRTADEDKWRATNPEARARAADTVAQLERSLADLAAQRDKAQAAGKDKAAAEADAAIAARSEWLAQARKAFEDFGG